ncbi:FkbM family methyltransferase [uncultured Dokdonia sp.]|uniref:FkbM family methyltransferase n=1 Tax=uncultured Dokdonia sp. TaxID=575653 RepID=UPI0026089A14|nr:FkbM family methyltransferase [uncultured Dokdonia sp.]
MNLFYGIIYHPKINKLIRNINYVLAPILPAKIKIYPTGKIKVHFKEVGPIYFKTNQTSFLTRELFWKGPEKFEFTSIFIKLIKKVDVFLDVGTNIGYYSILGGKFNPKLQVIAFEPSEGPRVYASENSKINNLEERIQIEPLALSNTTGILDFYNVTNPKFPNIHNLSGEHNLTTSKDKLNYTKVKATSVILDEYVASSKITTIDLMKIDTEGSEYLILEGAQKVLDTHRPIVICETLFNVIEDKLEAIFIDRDYAFYNHTGTGLTKVSSIQRTEDNGARNCFFVPKEKVALIEEFVV